MLMVEAGCLFMGFILHISGVHGQANRICALKGLSVELPCLTEHPISSKRWYTLHWDGNKYIVNNFSGDGNRTWYSMSEGSNFTLTINDLRDNDTNTYCCGDIPEIPGRCWLNRTELQVADLQVKVIPTTEEQTVTLMCSTSCTLAENPAAYIWYKNQEVLYQDWSPWYQHLVSSEAADKYSCAIKGYEDLRAPEVSVDSVTPTCFNVTYANGKMCSYHQKSEHEPCSITYPKEVYIQKTPVDETYVRLTCASHCPLTDPHTAYRWYMQQRLYKLSEGQNLTVCKEYYPIACAVKGHKYLHAAQVCHKDECMRVDYVRRTICALQGSSLIIQSEYSDPDNRTDVKAWYKIKTAGNQRLKEDELVTEDAARVKYHDLNNLHILQIHNLTQKDSAEYIFKIQTYGSNVTNLHGVTLVVSGLRVMMTPSAVVSEGQKVTLTCSTSCPLTDNSTYTWYLNSRPLTLPDSHNKYLVLDPVGGQDAGNYSCAVKSHNISSSEETLTVHVVGLSVAKINALRLTVALLIPVPLLLFHLWMRWTYSVTGSQKTEDSA